MRMFALAAVAAAAVSTGAHAQSPSSNAGYAVPMSASVSGELSVMNQRAISIAFLGHQQPSHSNYPVTAVPFPAFAVAKAAPGVSGIEDKAQVMVPLLVHAPIAAGGYPIVTVPSVTIK